MSLGFSRRGDRLRLVLIVARLIAFLTALIAVGTFVGLPPALSRASRMNCARAGRPPPTTPSRNATKASEGALKIYRGACGVAEIEPLALEELMASRSAAEVPKGL